MSEYATLATLFAEGFFTILASSPVELVRNKIVLAFLDVLRIVALTVISVITVHEYYRGAVSFSTVFSASSGAVAAFLLTNAVKAKAETKKRSVFMRNKVDDNRKRTYNKT